MAPRFCRDLGVRYFTRRRNVAGRILRTIPFKKIEMNRIGKVVDLLRLPGAEPFTVIVDAQAIAWRTNLFRKNKRIGCRVEGLGGQHPRTLMVFVVLTDHIVWKPSQNHLWPGKANQADYLVQSLAMSPDFKR